MEVVYAIAAIYVYAISNFVLCFTALCQPVPPLFGG